MKTSLRYLGLDVHQASITLAVADAGRGPAEVLATIPNDYQKLLQLLDKLGPKERLRLCYEAGPTGYGLARRLNELGYCCEVISPSLVPVQRGRRVKTDRRDARKLAHFLRSGDLTAVAIPEAQTEAMRDLERSRDDAKRAERVARQQLDKFMLRHGRIWSGVTKWTQTHLAWLREQEFAEPLLRHVRDDYLLALDQATARVERLTKDIENFVEQWAAKDLVLAFEALRGVQVVSAVVLAAEIGDFARFAEPAKLMSFIGLVPSESSSGGSRRQGSITRTGNGHVRRILVEAAWHYRIRPRGSKAIEARRRRVSPEVRAIAEKAEQRLSRRFERLIRRGKKSQQAVTAVARELLGFVWAIAREQARQAAAKSNATVANSNSPRRRTPQAMATIGFSEA